MCLYVPIIDITHEGVPYVPVNPECKCRSKLMIMMRTESCIPDDRQFHVTLLELKVTITLLLVVIIQQSGC